MLAFRRYPLLMIPDFVKSDLDALDLALNATQLEKLDSYLHLLLEANQRMNLTAIKDHDLAWRRLILDSLTILPGIDAPLDSGNTVKQVMDIGSGGGMPI